MRTIIGIDMGGSTTKIVGLKNHEIKSPMHIVADDPVTSLFGAFGRYLYQNNIALNDIEKVIITGVGSTHINQPLYGLPTEKADEFLANGLGARYQMNLERLTVISMGTGTSFVRVDENGIRHIGGLGIGGGTLAGMSNYMFKTKDIQQIVTLAEKGDVGKVNLQIQDISEVPIPNLPMTATAASFAKAGPNSLPEDMAAGVICLILQTIGQAAYFSSLDSDIKDFVLIGNLTNLPQCKATFQELEEIYHIRFHIPPMSEYRTAIGAALTHYHPELKK